MSIFNNCLSVALQSFSVLFLTQLLLKTAWTAETHSGKGQILILRCLRDDRSLQSQKWQLIGKEPTVLQSAPLWHQIL